MLVKLLYASIMQDCSALKIESYVLRMIYNGSICRLLSWRPVVQTSVLVHEPGSKFSSITPDR